jgi:hypothetical protein
MVKGESKERLQEATPIKAALKGQSKESDAIWRRTQGLTKQGH